MREGESEVTVKEGEREITMREGGRQPEKMIGHCKHYAFLLIFSGISST